MADRKTALSKIRDGHGSRGEKTQPRILADIEGMYGYDEFGRPLSRPVKGQGGFGIKPAQEIIAQTPTGPIRAEAPTFDLAILPQGEGAKWQNVYAGAPDGRELQAGITRMVSAPSTVERALNGDIVNGSKTPRMIDLAQLRRANNARFDALRPQNDPQFQDQVSMLARQNANAMPYENQVLRDVASLMPSQDVRDYSRPGRNALSQLRDLIAQALGGPTWEDPLRGRTYNRNPQGLPPDTGAAGIIGHNF